MMNMIQRALGYFEMVSEAPKEEVNKDGPTINQPTDWPTKGWVERLTKHVTT